MQATLDDYKNSGYDRGHLAAAANHKHDQAAMCETFLLSNIAPQVGANFNRGIWNDVERLVYTLLDSRYTDVYVCTGPLYLPDPTTKTVSYKVRGVRHGAGRQQSAAAGGSPGSLQRW